MIHDILHLYHVYMGVSIQNTMDNHYFEWVNQTEMAVFNGYVMLVTYGGFLK